MTKIESDKLKFLKKEEKRLFDTYRQNRSNADKSKHLKYMAYVIDMIEALEKKR